MTGDDDQRNFPEKHFEGPGSGVDDIELSQIASVPTSVGETAEAEIVTAQEKEEALDRHDLQWRRERDELANQSTYLPTFDLSSREHCNLLEEYEERRSDWEQRQAQIIEHHDGRRNAIRVNGRTLTDAFDRASGSGEPRDHHEEKARVPTEERPTKDVPSNAEPSQTEGFEVHPPDPGPSRSR